MLVLSIPANNAAIVVNNERGDFLFTFSVDHSTLQPIIMNRGMKVNVVASVSTMDDKCSGVFNLTSDKLNEEVEINISRHQRTQGLPGFKLAIDAARCIKFNRSLIV